MSKAKLYTQEGGESGELELNDAVFEAPINRRLLELVQNAFGGNLRRGTHSTKTRGEVRGGGKKPWRQKGTGRARHGSRRSPIWRGGGTVFGPHPRSYYTNLPDSMKQSALVSALSLKSQEQNLMFLKECKLKEAKTKELFKMIRALRLDGSKTLFVVNELDERLKRAAQNLRERFSVRRAGDVNAYHILHRKKILIEQSALTILEQRALGEPALKETPAEGLAVS